MKAATSSLKAPVIEAVYSSSLYTLEFFKTVLCAREADKREGILFRQGRGKFQLPGAGHEAVAALALATTPEDIFYPYYRDRALMLARGTSPYQLALDFFAKKDSSSGGKQLSSHYFDPERNMLSCATPTGLQCLPAAGTAWGMKRQNTSQVTLCCIGDAATRQGEFFEAWAFALQENLPLLMVVEDNGYGVSTPTQKMTPVNIGMLEQSRIIQCNGRNAEEIYSTAQNLIKKMRAGDGPFMLWLKLYRLMSHTSSDDQRLYRSAQELKTAQENDPLHILRETLQTLHPSLDFATVEKEISEEIRYIYEQAEQAANPDPEMLQNHVLSNHHYQTAHMLPHDKEWTMVEAINYALRYLLASKPNVLLFGEDIEDPKGGVFGLTKGLSMAYPEHVINSPLAEATICGLASGLTAQNIFPIFELQFIDFVGPAFNQIVNQIATLRWRTEGKQKCPMILLAPCGSYINCGGPWHSQTNESWFAHAPGLRVWMPSTADDAAHMILCAAQGEDPVLILLPKYLFRKKFSPSLALSHMESAVVRKTGEDVTLVGWGNTAELSLEAAKVLQDAHNISAEVIDLRTIVPCDMETIKHSVQKTGKLFVVQEDNKTCSFGQNLIQEICADSKIWNQLSVSPQLIARADVHVGYATVLEKAVLPSIEIIVNTVLGTDHGTISNRRSLAG